MTLESELCIDAANGSSRSALGSFGLVVLGALLGVPVGAQSEPPILLAEEAVKLGVDVVHQSGARGQMLLPEIMGAGVALFDFDRDGDLDLYVVNSGELVSAKDPKRLALPGERTAKDRLFRNELNDSGQSDFKTLRFTDVTEQVGLDARGYGLGVAVGDVNGDGWSDLYLANLDANQLWLNRQGTFERVTAGVEDARWSSSATLFDADADGDLDLFVANYSVWSPAKVVTCFAPNSRRDYCGPQSYAPEVDGFYLNDGNGQFSVAPSPSIQGSAGSGLGVIALDANGNGSLEILVANDGMANRLWSRGQDDWFDEGLLSGIAVNGSGSPEASMGVAVGDVDRDADEDVFMTHLDAETDTLLLNQGGGLFVDRTVASRLSTATLTQTSFGTAMVDLDADGLKDLVVTSGAVRLGVESGAAGSAALGQPNLVLLNAGADARRVPTFSAMAPGSAPAMAQALVSRGLAVGDLDNDGDADLVVSNVDGPVQILINQANPAQWMGLSLETSASTEARNQLANPPLLGWRVVRTIGEQRQVDVIRTDGSYLSASDPRLRFYAVNVGETLEVLALSDLESAESKATITVTTEHLGRYTQWTPPTNTAKNP